MCGIVGAVSGRNIADVIIECLKHLEYRGYDSAGIATINDQCSLSCIKTVGKIAVLINQLKITPVMGHIGIAHTRWATHGAPTKYNAHPHISNNRIALIHNGIIENYEELRIKLLNQGFKFTSDTDTEVIAHLIYSYLSKSSNLLTAVHEAIKELTGAFALAIISVSEPDRIIAVRSGSPVVIGLGINENFVASDTTALLQITNNFIYLNEGDLAIIEQKNVSIFNTELQPIKYQIKSSMLSADNIELGHYNHFMQKEIFEQPTALASTLEGRLLDSEIPAEIFGNTAKNIFNQITRIQIIACGSSLYSAIAGKYWLEKLAKIPCEVEFASEFRYRSTAIESNTLLVTISQSGETADTLAALRKAKKLSFLASLAICNVPESSLVRESDLIFLTRAGVEIGVATTKSFTAQLTALLMLAITLGKQRGLETTLIQHLIKQLKNLPSLIEQTLKLNDKISELAKLLEHSSSIFYIGRGTSYPIAMEGALKIKEISYIHAESYPAGELKHGPLALIDNGTPVVVLSPADGLSDKLKSNLQEIHARKGELIIFADKSLHYNNYSNWHICEMPMVDGDLAPIIYTIPLQLLAYHVALIKGTDIDQPRNLAKSVTVE
ncbi:MAG: glutamine--fructose-6-phosphate transaminase (isomerizing) [Coxiellaceae bacterium]|jgi:glucosamine--fructose-6-phosphate aminotransferase (isomerizing)|nr:glutamine--fructose-6-phosphate transaminase (isomerizing) [Coxiellaceae bacterium]